MRYKFTFTRIQMSESWIFSDHAMLFIAFHFMNEHGWSHIMYKSINKPHHSAKHQNKYRDSANRISVWRCAELIDFFFKSIYIECYIYRHALCAIFQHISSFLKIHKRHNFLHVVRLLPNLLSAYPTPFKLFLDYYLNYPQSRIYIIFKKIRFKCNQIGLKFELWPQKPNTSANRLFDKLIEPLLSSLFSDK